VGEGPVKSDIEALVHDLGLERRVLLSGFSAQPYAYMEHSQVFVLSSISEGFSMVILEAMACGLPVVATDCDWGPREIVTNGVDGLLVPPQEPELMGRAILALLGDHDMAARLAKAGMVRAREFAVGDAVTAYHDVAMECVRSKK
jgi:glycosyltransferase involved in cell wall biosynthesis